MTHKVNKNVHKQRQENTQRLKQTRLLSSTVKVVLTLKNRDNKEESLFYVVNWWEGRAGAGGKRERRRGARGRKEATVRRFKNNSMVRLQNNFLSSR